VATSKLGARSLAALVVALALPTAANAQWMASAYGGAFHTRPGDVRVQQPSHDTDIVFPQARFVSESWVSPIYYGYRVARRVGSTRWLYLEAELVHGKLFIQDPARTLGAGIANGLSVSDMPFSSVVDSVALSHGLNLVLANAVVRRAVGLERLTWTARLGAGAVVPHAESRVQGHVREDYQLAGAAMQLGSGVEVAFWHRLALLAEYKWTRARPHISLADGTATIATDSHHLALGLAAAF
jgi:opacity protein-like surface antigen